MCHLLLKTVNCFKWFSLMVIPHFGASVLPRTLVIPCKGPVWGEDRVPRTRSRTQFASLVLHEWARSSGLFSFCVYGSPAFYLFLLWLFCTLYFVAVVLVFCCCFLSPQSSSCCKHSVVWSLVVWNWIEFEPLAFVEGGWDTSTKPAISEGLSCALIFLFWKECPFDVYILSRK